GALDIDPCATFRPMTPGTIRVGARERGAKDLVTQHSGRSCMFPSRHFGDAFSKKLFARAFPILKRRGINREEDKGRRVNDPHRQRVLIKQMLQAGAVLGRSGTRHVGGGSHGSRENWKEYSFSAASLARQTCI